MASGSRTLDLNQVLQPHQMATAISNQYNEWESFRASWIDTTKEVREYVFATDTSSTTNAANPWKNSTHMPKLCQIRDNLHANYMAALFPNDRPIKWEGDTAEAELASKRKVIESYMENKLRLGQFRTEVSKCVYDWIDFGNCFAMTEFVAEKTTDPTTNETIPGFVGPKLVRISPLDIVFNPTSTSFENTPKIVRSLKTIGSLHADMQDHPEMGYLQEVFDDVVNLRHAFTGASLGDFQKNSAFAVDGFSSFVNYFQSDYVELLDFYGDYYDVEEKKFYKNYIITVADRCKIIRKIPNPSWFGKSSIKHCGWRLRPDNLYAMGPLDNLLGMQYRIDHLENAKADAFDLIIHPVLKIKGFVEDFDYEPGSRIYMDVDGDVEFERPDVTMLNADTQIAMYEMKMEEMAGAPKQAMGMRTPGEKTAYEVQILENGSNRIFLNKTSYFEEIFMEPALNDMLETARRNMGTSDLVRVLEDRIGVVNFMTITPEDITARGKIKPIGARHFARNANIIQNLTQFFSSPLGMDPAVNAHMSGKRLAKVAEELFDLERFDLVRDNIRIEEQVETEQLKQSGQQMIMEQGMPNEPTQGVNGVAPGPQV